MVLPSVHQHNPDCDIWVHEYFTPSWFCLPNNQPALTVVRPGDTARDTLELICKVLFSRKSRIGWRPLLHLSKGGGAGYALHMQAALHALVKVCTVCKQCLCEEQEAPLECFVSLYKFLTVCNKHTTSYPHTAQKA